MACGKSLPQHEKRKETYLLNVTLISAFVRNTGCNVQRKFEQNKLCELDNFDELDNQEVQVIKHLRLHRSTAKLKTVCFSKKLIFFRQVALHSRWLCMTGFSTRLPLST